MFQTEMYLFLMYSYVIYVAFSSSLLPEDQFAVVHVPSIFLNTRSTRT